MLLRRKEAWLQLSVLVGAPLLCPDTRSAALEHFHWFFCTRKGENPWVGFPGLTLLVTLFLAPSMDSAIYSFVLGWLSTKQPQHPQTLTKGHTCTNPSAFLFSPALSCLWKILGLTFAGISPFINRAAKTSFSIYSTTGKASFSAAQIMYLPPASQHSSKPSTTVQVHPLATQYSILLIASPRPTSPSPFLTTPFQTNSPYPCTYVLLAIRLCPIHTH